MKVTKKLSAILLGTLTMLMFVIMIPMTTYAEDAVVRFIKQPVGGIAEYGKTYTVTFDIGTTDYTVSIYEYVESIDEWLDFRTLVEGSPSFTLRPKALLGTTSRYKLAIDISDTEKIYSDEFEVTWGPVDFTEQPVSKIGRYGQPCEITFETLMTGEKVYLEKFVDGAWISDHVMEPGQTSYAIPYGTPGTEDRYHLRVYDTNISKNVYSNSFRITWEHYFTVQPVGGVSEEYGEYTITYDCTSKDYSVQLYKFEKSTGLWLDMTTLDEGANSYSFKDKDQMGQTSTYQLWATINDSDDRYIIRSNEFDITWAPVLFTTQPVSGTAERGRPYTITFANSMPQETVRLEKFDGRMYGKNIWKDVAEMKPGVTSYDIPHGIPGETDTYRLYTWAYPTTGVRNKVYSDEFEVTWPHDFLVQPVGGVSEDGQAFTVTYEISLKNSTVSLYKYNEITGAWKLQSTNAKGKTSYKISPGTMGTIDRYMLAIDVSRGEKIFSDKFEVAWGPVAFTKQPVSKTIEPGQPCEIVFETPLIEKNVYLEKYVNGGWLKDHVMEPGQTSYAIPYGTPGTTDIYHLRVYDTNIGKHLYSNDFEITWAPDRFITQPVGGISEEGRYTITFDHYLTDKPIILGKGVDLEHLLWISSIEPGKTSYDIPYGSSNENEHFVLIIPDGGGPGVHVYSDDFKVIWADYFTTKPFGGISEPGKPYTITFANYVKENCVILEQYDENAGNWVNVTRFEKGQTSYDIACGTPGTTDRYRLRIEHGVNARVDVYGDEFEIIWKKAGAVTKSRKDDLVTVPETIKAGSVLVVNEDALPDAFLEGYLYEYVTWVYTSAAGETSTYRFDKDYDKFTVTEDMLGGTVQCEVYNDDESVALVSPEIKLGEKKAPVITTQPKDVTVEAGKAAKFSITATGDGLTYQWEYQKPGTTTWTKPGATSAKTANYSLTAALTHNGYKIRCVVTDKNGKSATSNVVALSVKAPALAITTQPKDVSVVAGQTANFTIVAVGERLTYQWEYQKPGSTTWTRPGAASAKTATYSLSTVYAHNGYKLRCVVADKSGKTVTSAAVTLTVTSVGPVITTQPKDVSVEAGQTVKFSIAATGDNLTYRWEYQKPGSTTWTRPGAASAKTANYSLATVYAHNGYKLRCVIADKSGKTVTSDVVTLTVTSAGPTIATQPADVSVEAGQKAVFSIVATGDNVTYQWEYQKPGTTTWSKPGAASAKTAKYSLTTAAAHNGYKIRCVVTDKNGKTVTSNAATLSVTVAFAIKTQPVDVSVAAGQKAIFSIVATGEGLTYQWEYQKPGSTTWTKPGAASAKTANYSLTTAAAHNGFKIRCVVTDQNGQTVTSNAVTLSVN